MAEESKRNGTQASYGTTGETPSSQGPTATSVTVGSSGSPKKTSLLSKHSSSGAGTGAGSGRGATMNDPSDSTKWLFVPVELTLSATVVVSSSLGSSISTLESAPLGYRFLIGVVMHLLQALGYPSLFLWTLRHQGHIVGWVGHFIVSRVFPYMMTAFHLYTAWLWLVPAIDAIAYSTSQLISLQQSDIDAPPFDWMQFRSLACGTFGLIMIALPIYILLCLLAWHPLGTYDITEGLFADIAKCFLPERPTFSSIRRAVREEHARRKIIHRTLRTRSSSPREKSPTPCNVGKSPKPADVSTVSTNRRKRKEGTASGNSWSFLKEPLLLNAVLSDPGAIPTLSTCSLVTTATGGTGATGGPGSWSTGTHTTNSALAGRNSRFDPSLCGSGSHVGTASVTTSGPPTNENDKEQLQLLREEAASGVDYPQFVLWLETTVTSFLLYFFALIWCVWCAVFQLSVRAIWHCLGGPTSNKFVESQISRWEEEADDVARRNRRASSTTPAARAAGASGGRASSGGTPPRRRSVPRPIQLPSVYFMQRLKFLMISPLLLAVIACPVRHGSGACRAVHTFTCLNALSISGIFASKGAQQELHARQAAYNRRSTASTVTGMRSSVPTRRKADGKLPLLNPQDFAWPQRWILVCGFIVTDVLVTLFISK